MWRPPSPPGFDFPANPTVGETFEDRWMWDGQKWVSTGGAGTVSSVFGRGGAVVAAFGDYSFDQIAGQVQPAQLSVFTATAIGAVPPPGSATPATYVLAANGTWVQQSEPAIATAAQIRNNTAGLLLNTDQSWAAAVPIAIGLTGTLNLDMAAGINFEAPGAATGDMTLTFSNAAKPGQSGIIAVQAGAFSVAFSGNWVLPSTGAPAANGSGWTIYSYFVLSDGSVAVNKVL
jgi:hypothetical protein